MYSVANEGNVYILDNQDKLYNDDNLDNIDNFDKIFKTCFLNLYMVSIDTSAS